MLERQDATWRMTSPLQARADAFQVGRVLSILGARSTVRYRADDLARFGLDRPLAKVTVDDQSFTYGALNTTTREQYVLTGESVYVVPLSHGAALPREPDALIARELFAPGETPVRFELPEVQRRASRTGRGTSQPARTKRAPTSASHGSMRGGTRSAVRGRGTTAAAAHAATSKSP